MTEYSNEYYLTLFKSRIINKLCNDDMTVKLLAPTPNPRLEIADVLRGGLWKFGTNVIEEQGHIFDYKYVDKTTDETKAFICVEVLPSVFSYPTLDIIMYIHVYIHKSIMRLTTEGAPKPSIPTSTEMAKYGFIGNRCDQLTQAIGKLINGATDIGGISEIKPYNRGYIVLDIPNDNFYGKCMMFNVKISNVEGLNCEN